MPLPFPDLMQRVGFLQGEQQCKWSDVKNHNTVYNNFLDTMLQIVWYYAKLLQLASSNVNSAMVISKCRTMAG